MLIGRVSGKRRGNADNSGRRGSHRRGGTHPQQSANRNPEFEYKPTNQNPAQKLSEGGYFYRSQSDNVGRERVTENVQGM